MTPAEQEDAAYRRGEVDGEIRARLAAHDQHFMVINGQLGKVAGELSSLSMQVQRLADQAVAGAELQRGVSAAISGQQQRVWTTWSKALALVGGAASVAAVVGVVVALFGR